MYKRQELFGDQHVKVGQMFSYTALYEALKNLGRSGEQADRPEVFRAGGILSRLRDHDNRRLSPFIGKVGQSKTRVEQISQELNFRRREKA